MFRSGNISLAHLDDVAEIRTFAESLTLDTAGLRSQDCLIYRYGNTLAGMGRVRQHADCYELCTLGVSEAYRGKGISFLIVHALINAFNAPLHVVTDIPHFFSRFGFVACHAMSESLKLKQQRCLEELDCELAMVMVRNPS